MTALPSISVNTCEIEFFDGEEDCIGTPTSMRGQSVEIAGKLRRFRVTSLDELNIIVGLTVWDNGDVEVRPLQLVSGLSKHNALDNRGGMSLLRSRDEKWLVPLRVLKFNQERKYFTLQSASLPEIDGILGHSFKDFLTAAGALRVGTRQLIDSETSRSSNQLAMVVEVGDLPTVALAYTVTRALAVIKDNGLQINV